MTIAYEVRFENGTSMHLVAGDLNNAAIIAADSIASCLPPLPDNYRVVRPTIVREHGACVTCGTRPPGETHLINLHTGADVMICVACLTSMHIKRHE